MKIWASVCEYESMSRMQRDSTRNFQSVRDASEAQMDASRCAHAQSNTRREWSDGERLPGEGNIDRRQVAIHQQSEQAGNAGKQYRRA